MNAWAVKQSLCTLRSAVLSTHCEVMCICKTSLILRQLLSMCRGLPTLPSRLHFSSFPQRATPGTVQPQGPLHGRGRHGQGLWSSTGTCFVHISTPNLMKTLQDRHYKLPASNSAVQRNPAPSQSSQSLSGAGVGFSASSLCLTSCPWVPLLTAQGEVSVLKPACLDKNFVGLVLSHLWPPSWGDPLGGIEGARDTGSQSLQAPVQGRCLNE